MKKNIIIAASGVLALLCLFLAVGGVSALTISGAWRSAEAEIFAERNDDGRVSGNLLVWLDNEDWAQLPPFDMSCP